MSSSRPVGLMDRSSRFRVWKEQQVPLLYDWISSRRLVWPHAAAQWGAPVIDDNSRHRSTPTSTHSTRALYLAERTGASKRDPNTLLYFDVRVVRELVNKPSDVAKPWLDEAVVVGRSDQMSTPDFWLKKRIIHPGEVNKIRLVVPGVVVTHTDSPNLYVWDFATQEDRKKDAQKTDYSKPTCTLVGHTRDAEYALDVAKQPNSIAQNEEASSRDVWIASGGSDCCVLVWRLADYQSMGRDVHHFAQMTSTGGRVGHTATVEGVSFNRVDRNMLASVGRDSALLVWDLRSRTVPICNVQNAHKGDINACDYGGAEEHLIVTGGSDSMVRVWDRRFIKDRLGTPTPLHSLRGHTGQITNVMWNKYVPNVCATSSDDGEVLVWDCSGTNSTPDDPLLRPASPQLMFKHVGHSMDECTVVDIEWQPSESDPWCLATLSEAVNSGGSVLQMWRISDLVYRPKDQVAADLRQFAKSQR